MHSVMHGDGILYMEFGLTWEKYGFKCTAEVHSNNLLTFTLYMIYKSVSVQEETPSKCDPQQQFI